MTLTRTISTRIAPLVAAAAVAVAAVTAVAAAGSGGVTGPAFYVDGELYRTVGTPTDLSRTKAPDHSFDVIYDFGGGQPNVADAAPGHPGYNGGRWRVHALGFNTSWAMTVSAHDSNDSGDLDSVVEIYDALADNGPAGAIDMGIVKSFVCPAIPVPGN